MTFFKNNIILLLDTDIFFGFTGVTYFKMVLRDKKGRFVKGHVSISAGRPKGSVNTQRALALQIIFTVFEEYKDLFTAKMRALAEQNIVGYYLKFVAPFLPSQINLTAELSPRISIYDFQESIKKIEQEYDHTLENSLVKR